MCMYFFQYFMIAPLLSFVSDAPTLNFFYFSILVMATVSIAAAGYAVNDYMDYDIDRDYKPKQLVVGKIISLDATVYIIGILNAVGIGLGFFISWKIGFIKQGNIFLLAAILLGVYSMVLKKYFLVGNLLIAILSGFLFVLVVLFEHKLLMDVIEPRLIGVVYKAYYQMIGYALFAFWVMLIREIAKDAEDKEGDNAANYYTLGGRLPIVAVNSIIAIMVIALMIAIGFLQYVYWQTSSMNYFYYALFFLQFPMLLLLIALLNTTTQKDYHNFSVQVKLLMLFGICSLPVFYFFTKYNIA